MICLSEDELLQAELGELTYHRTLELREHEAACTRCRALLREQRALLSDLAVAPALERSDAEFTASVLAASAADDDAPRAPAEKRSLAPLYGVLALAAAACVWLLRPAPAPERITARGAAHGTLAPVEVDARLARAGALLPLSGAELHAGDGLTARYVNRSGRSEYLALFAIDAAGAVHWIFPAYLDPAQNPRSIPLAPDDAGRLLPDAVEPESPAPGPMRVISLVSEAPLAVREIEQRLASGRSPAELFPEARIREWNATWTAR